MKKIWTEDKPSLVKGSVLYFTYVWSFPKDYEILFLTHEGREKAVTEAVERGLEGLEAAQFLEAEAAKDWRKK